MPPAPARCASAPRAAVLQSHPWVPVRSGGMSQHRGRGVTQKLFRSLWFFFHGLAVTELLASCAASRQVLAHRAPMAFRPPCRAVMHTLFFFFYYFIFPPTFSSLGFPLPQILFFRSCFISSLCTAQCSPTSRCTPGALPALPGCKLSTSCCFFLPKKSKKNEKKKIHTPPNPNQLLLAETSTSSLGSQQSTPLRSRGARGFMPEGLLKLCQKSSFFRAACDESKAFCFTFCCDVWGGRLLGAG